MLKSEFRKRLGCVSGEWVVVEAGHTFLFEPGSWKGLGFVVDEHGHEIQAEGWTKIIHVQQNWINRSTIELRDKGRTRFETTYVILPFMKGRDSTQWTSENPLLGPLKGSFVLVGETIMSLFGSENGQFSGCETVLRVDDNTYKNVGMLFKATTKTSSWRFELNRER